MINELVREHLRYDGALWRLPTLVTLAMPIEITTRSNRSNDRVRVLGRSHPKEDEMECFALSRAMPEEAQAIEEHLLTCNACLEWLGTIEEELHLFRSALRALQLLPTRSTRKLPLARVCRTTSLIVRQNGRRSRKQEAGRADLRV